MRPNQGFFETYSLLIGQILATLLAGILFFVSKGHLISLLPIFILPIILLARRIAGGANADQEILLGFIILAFFIDDMSQVPWGRTVEPMTELLGQILFRSFGITGMEVFILLFGAWIIIMEGPKHFQSWYRLGLFSLLSVAGCVFASSLLSGVIGLSSGGVLETMFIQIRFLHALPLWTLIGFVVWRDKVFIERALKWITIMVALKSFQGVYVYLANRAIFAEEEYLIDHYYSGFAVVGGLGLCYFFYRYRSPLVRALCVLSLAAVSVSYLVNDRRTSYVGVAFALAVLPTLLPFSVLRRYAGRGLALILAFIVFNGVTWNLPPPLGFVGTLYSSFGTETGTNEPSYRELENANLINAVTVDPMKGIGYGKEFDEIFPLPDVSTVYERYRMLPHNTFLATWAYGGPQTMAALGLLFAMMIAASGALIRRTRDPILVFFAVTSLFYTLQFLTYTFGDLGFQIMRNQMIAGLFLGGCFRMQAELKRLGGNNPWH